jgi:hypothetical protein
LEEANINTLIKAGEYVAEEVEIKEVKYRGKPTRTQKTELYEILYDEDEVTLTSDAKLRRHIAIVKTPDVTIAIAATSQDLLQQNLSEIIKQIEAKQTT